MSRIRLDDVVWMHDYLLRKFGGLPGIRDKGLLESALSAPFQTFAGVSPYPDPLQRAAKLAQGLIGNHPFNDGNKRIGVHVMVLYLEDSGIEVTADNQQLADFGLSVARHADLDYINDWLAAHTSRGR